MTRVEPAEAGRGTAFSASSRGDTERLYRAAARHSRRVRWLRIGVLASIVATLLVVVIADYMPPIGGFRLPGELGKLVIKGTKITMAQPRLTGYTDDSRAYEFTAKSAAQDITKPDLVELLQLHARMQLQDRSTVDMSATSGVYDMKSELLTLHDNIALASSTGYEGRLSEATVDMRNGSVVSDHPVWIKMLDGVLNAKRLEVVDKGAVVRFSDVAMTLIPRQQPAAADDER
ncbi:MAG TPA: LPS export ABC transporter periplasmic protein LptC [Xanthobacteraceae bacterium]